MEVKLRWRWSTLDCCSRIRLHSFVFGLAVTFLIMASYILTGDKKGLLLTPSPFHVSSLVSPGPFHSSRKIPEFKVLENSDPHMFSVIPRQFQPGVKSPCWYEEYTGNITSDPYRKNMYAHYSKHIRTEFQFLRNTFREHLIHNDGKLYRMRCLPYFYIIGQPKCGTTDLYDRLKLRPDVRFSILKEPQWWARKRFGSDRLGKGVEVVYPLEDYLDVFDHAAYQIQGNFTGKGSGGPSHPNIIIGEASASTMWDNNAWVKFYGNTTEREPPLLVQDFIHALQPDARFIIMLRDPVERLYSDYLYFGIANMSAEDFHEKVSESLQLFEGCLTEYTMRSCVYNVTRNNAMPVRLQIGLYILFLLDWLTVFSREQILVLRLEDQASNQKYTMHKAFDFLNLGPLTEEIESEITRNPPSNTRKAANKNLGPMLPITKEILRDFYRPFNEELAKVLRNDSFLWDY